jgi:hypothetical protein
LKAKWDATIAIVLDKLCKIFSLVVTHSPSLLNGLEFRDALRLNVKASSLSELGNLVVILELGMKFVIF